MATLIGLDDTDSREAGMCTTYVGARLADRLEAAGHPVVERFLFRLNPAVPYKTRGNAAVAVLTGAPPETAFDLGRDTVSTLAVRDDRRTNPGLAVVDASAAIELGPLAVDAMRRFVDPDRAIAALDAVEATTWTAGSGRGIVGAAAAIGCVDTVTERTVELIAYREPARWGSPRQVDDASVFAASAGTYPATWDTVDRGAEAVICTPRTPGPVLYGIRGDDRGVVELAADRLVHEPIERRSTFVTNQGTDVHIEPVDARGARDGRAYRVHGRVVEAPTTAPGGHVHFAVASAGATLPCVAFEPTKRFRHHVRRLVPGDRVTVCGEVGEGTLKLEKFALRAPRRYRRAIPTCSRCDARMESAGRTQGYRCQGCAQTAPGRVVEPLERDIAVGWYEVPPVARRHVAKPLIRGGLDGPIHPER